MGFWGGEEAAGVRVCGFGEAVEEGLEAGLEGAWGGRGGGGESWERVVGWAREGEFEVVGEALEADSGWHCCYIEVVVLLGRRVVVVRFREMRREVEVVDDASGDLFTRLSFLDFMSSSSSPQPHFWDIIGIIMIRF